MRRLETGTQHERSFKQLVTLASQIGHGVHHFSDNSFIDVTSDTQKINARTTGIRIFSPYYIDDSISGLDIENLSIDKPFLRKPEITITTQSIALRGNHPAVVLDSTSTTPDPSNVNPNRYIRFLEAVKKGEATDGIPPGFRFPDEEIPLDEYVKQNVGWLLDYSIRHGRRSIVMPDRSVDANGISQYITYGDRNQFGIERFQTQRERDRITVYSDGGGLPLILEMRYDDNELVRAEVVKSEGEEAVVTRWFPSSLEDRFYLVGLLDWILEPLVDSERTPT